MSGLDDYDDDGMSECYWCHRERPEKELTAHRATVKKGRSFLGCVVVVCADSPQCQEFGPQAYVEGDVS